MPFRSYKFVPGACPFCGGFFEYVASSELYHRYECTCGVKLLVPKGEK